MGVTMKVHWTAALSLGLAVSLACSAAAAAQLAEKKALTLELAKQMALAAEKEAAGNKWTMVIAVLDDGGNLLYLERMDETQIGSIEVAIQKARSALSFKRPTKAFEDAVAGGRVAVLKLPGALPIEGGVPILVDGKVIGAIGVSGGTSQQDGLVAKAGADALAAALRASLGQHLAGVWDAAVIVNELEIPFRMEFAGGGTAVKGSFVNGEERVTSTSGRFDNGALALRFDQYASTLEATWRDGVLEGKYSRGARANYPFRARRFTPATASNAAPPSIAGIWEIVVSSPKGESAWRFIVRQSGAEVSAAILRVDGDTGTLSGRYQDGKFVLSHFSGARPARLEVTPANDGTLRLVLNGKDLTATRPAEARAKGMPAPADPSRHTSVKDPSEPFRFRFPDLTGRLVSESDPRFRGKVLLVNITGSWCPNCHDEAPFLAELYRKYRDQGLEIVALSFEEAEQLKDPARLRAFIREYGI